MNWALLAPLPESERRDLLAAARRRRFGRNEVICHDGDEADSLHLVESGHLSVRVSLESGDTAMLSVLGPGDYFGELALLRRTGRRTATITALENSQTLVVAGDDFRRLCQDRPAVSAALTCALADRVDELSQNLLEVLYLGVDRRVFRQLARLANTYGAQQPVFVPLTQTQLADLTGATRPSVNQALHRLVTAGIISLGRGQIEVLDVAALRRRAGL